MTIAVICGSCKIMLQEDPGLEENQRRPCPACGSLTRSFYEQILAGIRIKHTITMSEGTQSIRAITDLLMQTIVVAGAETLEGRLIELVAVPWFEIVEFLKKDPNAAFQIPENSRGRGVRQKNEHQPHA
jgi:hypothetical protein